MHAFMYNPNERFHAKDGFAIPCCWSLLQNTNSSNFISLGINMFNYLQKYLSVNYMSTITNMRSSTMCYSFFICKLQVGRHVLGIIHN